MKIYKTQEEVEKDIKDGVLVIDGDVKFECSISIDASIDAGDINARDINAVNIDARNIDAWDINAWDINAWDIDARDITYYGVCFAYDNIECTSINGRKENAKHFCLDGEITIKKNTKKQELIDKAEELKAKANELLEKAEEL
jgi:hypothetical protein